MSSLFAVLFLLALIGLIAGLIKPTLFKPVFKTRTKRKFIGLSIGGLLLLFLILTGVTAPNTTKSSSRLTSPNHPTYKPLDAWYTDPGWVGYVNSGKDFKSISASWTVPTVRQSAPDNTPDQDELMSSWIGIGGFNSPQLIQAGTNQSVVSVEGGTSAYLAFWERYPLDPATVQIKEMTISPGDKISASISQQAGNSWLLQLWDLSNGQSFSKTVSFSADQTTAEWIMESEPTNGNVNGPRVLPNFGSVTFSSLNVNGHTPTGLRKIKMVRGGQTIVGPSALAGADSFTISQP